VRQGVKCWRTIFNDRADSVWILEKARSDTICWTCVFASSVICGSQSVSDTSGRETSTQLFWRSGWLGASGVRNIEALFFKLGWARYGSWEKRDWTRFTELVFLHLVRSSSHVMCFRASGAWNIDALFFILGWARCRYHKMRTWTPYAKFFFIQCDLRIMHCIQMRPRHETLMYYFLCSGGPVVDPIKSVLGHITMNLCFCIRCSLRVT
jgi:hypothetical protein